ncbi:universal stress protein [Blastococcus sp. CT_GayMR19]|uniref:universal stress protein n=1 Tax=Blastococcus sp. CT_GayMR19 TaxID=2559608 RepID=UPI0010742C6C|nr:universal stress protein [Blastococcus sp. CT_GayMR19]TFV71013.1 universal stress protein [Blastococcus sp. CT_GayMR19]
MDAQPRASADPIHSGAAPLVLVGVDGSAGSLTALRWAMHWALVRGAEVAVVAAYPTSRYWSDAEIIDLGALDAVHDDTWARARAAVDAVRDSDPAVGDVPVSLHIEPGPAAAQLVRHSADADLLVVGSRGRSALRSALLGSVALHSVSAAECPVVVVPLPGRWAEPRAGSQVVVGIDGSERSATALTAALTQAGPGGSVTVVRAVDVTDLWSDQYPVVSGPSQQQLRDDARRRMEVTLGELLLATTDEPPTVQRLALRGQAGPVLVEQAAGADLLVVASRGHGEFRGLVFGSVALHCVVHAPCPVLVVRPAARQSASRSTLVASAASR